MRYNNNCFSLDKLETEKEPQPYLEERHCQTNFLKINPAQVKFDADIKISREPRTLQPSHTKGAKI